MICMNHFTAAGGLPFVIRELLDAGLLHDDVDTVGQLDFTAGTAGQVGQQVKNARSQDV